jgi:site-specific recombinase XerD
MSDRRFQHELWLSKMRDHLKDEQYAVRTAQTCLLVARRFLASLEAQRVEVDAVRPSEVERYLRIAEKQYRRRHGHGPGYRSWRYARTCGIHMLLRVAQGKWPPAPLAVTSSEVLQKEICEAYADWMTNVRGLAHQTVQDCTAEAHRFLTWLGDSANRLSVLTLRNVDAYMEDRAGSLSRRSLSGQATRLRSFLRFLHLTGKTAKDLSATVIAPSLHAFEGIPSAISTQDVSKVLIVAGQDHTRKGLRDYAILMLLTKYGLRAGEITTLRLDDFDWRRDRIRIHHSKTGATSWLPLLPEPGEAVLTYLEKSRPKTALREVFIRCKAPYRPFKDGSSLYGMIQCRLQAAGVVPAGKRGPHAFRHARAVGMLRATVPVKEIGDLLGHRAADSTLVYLKLATEDLRAVAMEVPAGANS